MKLSAELFTRQRGLILKFAVPLAVIIVLLLSGCAGSGDDAAPLPTAVDSTRLTSSSLDSPERATADQDLGKGAAAPDSSKGPSASASIEGILDSLAESAPTTAPESNNPAPPVPEPASTDVPAAPAVLEGPLPEVGPRVGLLAPEFTLVTLEGEEIALSDLRGHDVLLNYWASWCPPCIEELGYFETLQQEYENQGFRVIAVNGIEQDNLDDVHSTVSQVGITYPVVMDHDELVWKDYQVMFMPTTFYIDERGVIQAVQLGSATEEEFRAKVLDLIDG